MKNELKKFQKVLSSGYPECLDIQRDDRELLKDEDNEHNGSSKESLLKMTLHFLRRQKETELADCLQSSKRI